MQYVPATPREGRVRSSCAGDPPVSYRFNYPAGFTPSHLWAPSTFLHRPYRFLLPSTFRGGVVDKREATVSYLTISSREEIVDRENCAFANFRFKIVSDDYIKTACVEDRKGAGKQEDIPFAKYSRASSEARNFERTTECQLCPDRLCHLHGPSLYAAADRFAGITSVLTRPRYYRFFANFIAHGRSSIARDQPPRWLLGKRSLRRDLDSISRYVELDRTAGTFRNICLGPDR